MLMIDGLLKVLGLSRIRQDGADHLPGRRGRMRAGFNAARDTRENQNLWAGADNLSANESTSPEARAKMRSRARFECENNGYADGIVTTYADDVVGIGPTLQMKLGDSKLNTIVEQAWADWADATDFNGKLHLLFTGQVRDGDGIALMVTNPRVQHSVLLDLMPIEPEHVASSPFTAPAPNEYDGIVYDEFRNPVKYIVAYEQAGSVNAMAARIEYRPIDASQVIHMFRARRACQSRGASEIAPGLSMFAKLRRFTEAVIGAAETAADFAGVIQTRLPASGEAKKIQMLDAIELESRALLTLPDGWELGQVDAKQPTTTYGDFKGQVLNEAARPLSMPFNVAACNSSSYNYASGRLDHQKYDKRVAVRRERIRLQCLDRVLHAFLQELARVDPRVPRSILDSMHVPHEWYWPGGEHVDPTKEATAQDVKLKNGSTSLARECARDGIDWEDHLDQIEREEKGRLARGLPSMFAKPQAEKPVTVGGKDDEDEDEDA